MESRNLTISRDLSEESAEIFREYFVQKHDMSRAGMFVEIHDSYNPDTSTVTVEAEVHESVSVERARQAVEKAFMFAESIGAHD
jgi:hypothetical protein